jgi:hypothetical protein
MDLHMSNIYFFFKECAGSFRNNVASVLLRPPNAATSAGNIYTAECFGAFVHVLQVIAKPTVAVLAKHLL